AQSTLAANITPAPLTVIGVTANNKVYDGKLTASLDVSNATLVGVFSGDVVTLAAASAIGTFASKDVGNAIAVTVSGLQLAGVQGGNYALTQPVAAASITPFALTVSGVTAHDKVYDASTLTTLNTDSAVLQGVFSADTVTLSTAGAVGMLTSKD